MLGRISTEEHANIFLNEPGRVIGSQDHTCVEAQRRVGKRLYDYAISMNIQKKGGSQGAWNRGRLGPAQLCLENLAHNWHTGVPKRLAKPQFPIDSQSVDPNSFVPGPASACLRGTEWARLGRGEFDAGFDEVKSSAASHDARNLRLVESRCGT